MECLKHQVGPDRNKGMDMVVKVAMECQKHKIGLDCNKGMDMVWTWLSRLPWSVKSTR